MQSDRTILVIDDEEMVRSLARKILNRAGFAAALVSSGEEGLTTLKRQPPPCSLVIMDYSLDDLSGVDLMYAVRSVVPGIPIIVSSGEAIDLDNIPIELHLHMRILSKPYRAFELTESVKIALAIFSPSM